jgi:hypothetical protein
MTDLRPSVRRPHAVLSRLGGADPESLARSGADDRMTAVRTGLALGLGFVFSAGAAFAALSIALPSVAPYWLLPPALVFAAMVAALDHAMIHSHWLSAGFEAARRRGLAAPGEPRGLASLPLAFSAGLRGLAAAAARVTLSFAIAFLVGSLAELMLFAPDIAARREAERRLANAPAVQAATRAFERRLAAAEADAAAAGRQAAASAVRAEARAAEVTEAARDAALALAGRVAALEDRRAAHLAEAARARAHADSERFGQVSDPRHSGLPGKGGRHGFWTSRAEAEEARAVEVVAEIARLRAAPDGLGEARRDAEALLARAARDSVRADELAAARDALAARRPAEIAAALRADPGHVEPTDGLVLRLEAMRALRESPATFAFALALKAVIMLVEMGALVARVLLSAPSLYGVRAATAFETAAAAEIDAAAALLDAAAGRAAGRAERADERQERQDRSRRQRQAGRRARAGFGRILDHAIERASAR